MELHELHVAQLGAGAIGRRHAVAGGHRRVGGFAIDHAGAAAGEDRLLGPDELLALTGPRQHGTDAAAFVGEQIEREGVVPERQVRHVPGAVDDGAHDLEAGGVAECMDDAAMAVAPFARQGEMALFLVEMRAPVDQGRDLPRRLAHHHFDDVAMAQTAAGRERVLDMVLEAVFRRHDARDAPLGIIAVALLNLVLGDDEHVNARRHRQRRTQTRDAAADDEDVGENVRRLLRIELHQIAMGHCGGSSNHASFGQPWNGSPSRSI